MHVSRTVIGLTGAAAMALVAVSAGQPGVAATRGRAPTLPGGYRHLVVIYEENHSFDNLYGHWGSVNGQRVNGLNSASLPGKRQVAQDGSRYGCLLQNDVNLTSPSPLRSTCQDATHGVPDSHFRNRPFLVDRYIKPEDHTCPAPGTSAPNGVLKDSPGRPARRLHA